MTETAIALHYRVVRDPSNGHEEDPSPSPSPAEAPTEPTLQSIAKRLDEVAATALLSATEATRAREICQRMGSQVLSIYAAAKMPMKKKITLILAGAAAGGFGAVILFRVGLWAVTSPMVRELLMR